MSAKTPILASIYQNFAYSIPLRAHLQMTKLHHKLCFIKFIITSEVIIKVPLAEAALAETVLAEATPAKAGL